MCTSCLALGFTIGVFWKEEGCHGGRGEDAAGGGRLLCCPREGEGAVKSQSVFDIGYWIFFLLVYLHSDCVFAPKS